MWTLLNTAPHCQADVWTTITRHALHTSAAVLTGWKATGQQATALPPIPVKTVMTLLQVNAVTAVMPSKLFGASLLVML